RFSLYAFRYSNQILQPVMHGTVIEAMNYGLPIFATKQGGSAEIIVDGISGFHTDPNKCDESSNKIANFSEKCKVDAECWN
ncbi:Sucrose synthase 6, partial [Sarracenia purpurea var. burkii]